MANFRNNQDYGVNPYLEAATGAKQASWPLAVIPQCGPRQSTSEEDPENPGEYLYGGTSIFPQIIDWPWASDNDGNSFDQSNLYGIRFLCYRRTVVDGGGDIDSEWIAVPKSLPGGYTAGGRCDMGPAFLTIVGSLNPFQGTDIDTDSDLSNGLGGAAPSTWSIRTADSIIPDVTNNPDLIVYANWVPMNLGQRLWGTVGGGTNQTTQLYDNVYDPETGGGDYDDIYIGFLATDHVGFRAGNLYFFAGDGATDGTDTWYIGRRSSDDLPVQPYSVGDFYDTVHTIEVSYTSADFNEEKEIALPGSLLAVNNGRVSHFIVWTKVTRREPDGTFISDYGNNSSFKGMRLAPRTDVPFWFFASTGNKCAPGGYIAPP